MLPWKLVPCLHEHPDGCRCCVPNGNFLSFKEAVPVFGTESSFINNLSGPIRPGAKHSVGGPGDPARVCCTPVDIFLLEIQDIFGGGVMAHHSPMDMDSPFRFSRCAGRVVHNGL